MAGISGALFLSARSLESDANREDHDLSRRQLRDHVRTRRLVASTTGITASGLVIGGIVKLVIRPSQHRPDRPTFGVALSVDGVVISARIPVP